VRKDSATGGSDRGSDQESVERLVVIGSSYFWRPLGGFQGPALGQRFEPCGRGDPTQRLTERVGQRGRHQLAWAERRRRRCRRRRQVRREERRISCGDGDGGRSGGVDGLAKNVGEAGKQLARLADEVRTGRKKAEEIGKALS